MPWLARLNRPWIHFIAIGVLLFWLQASFFPAPPAVIGPLEETRVEALKQQWFRTVGRAPSDQQLRRMIDAELDRDMLFQRALELQLHLRDRVVYQRLLRNMHFLQLAEGKSDEELYRQALAMRLHLGDEVIKRRMVQVMEQLILASAPPQRPAAEQIEAAFERRRQELRRPPRYSIEHIYFNREREPEAGEIVARIQAQAMGPEQARELSSPFLPGYRFLKQSPEQLARHFGAALVLNFESAGPVAGQWLGPVRSTYGLHYIYVHEVEPERDASLEEVRPQLQRDLETQARSVALRQGIGKMREDYEVLR